MKAHSRSHQRLNAIIEIEFRTRIKCVMLMIMIDSHEPRPNQFSHKIMAIERRTEKIRVQFAHDMYSESRQAQNKHIF